MAQLQEAILMVLVSMVGIFFTWLKKFIDAKNDELKARTSVKQYELVQSITNTVVTAVEQIAQTVALSSGEKFEKADKMLTSELSKAGITLTEDTKRALIESVVNGYNQLKK